MDAVLVSFYFGLLENGISLADLLGEVGEGIDLEYCSFFIDATIVAIGLHVPITNQQKNVTYGPKGPLTATLW